MFQIDCCKIFFFKSYNRLKYSQFFIEYSFILFTISVNSLYKDITIRKILQIKMSMKNSKCPMSFIFVLIPFLILYFEEFVRFRLSTK